MHYYQNNSVKSAQYEKQIHTLLEKAIVLDHSKSPCDDDFLPKTINDNDDRSYVVFIKMAHSKDYSTWLKMASCFGKLEKNQNKTHLNLLHSSCN